MTAAGPLGAHVTSLPGIGPKVAAALAERDVVTVEDMIWLVPRRYDDARTVTALDEALAGPLDARVTTSGVVAAAQFRRRGRMRWVQLRVASDCAQLTIRWFNAHPGMAKRFPKGSTVVVSGVVRERDSGFEMANPDILGDGPAIIPRYGAVPGVPASTLRKACRAAVERGAADIVDGVPADIVRAAGLDGLGDALLGLHSPPESLSVEAVVELNSGTSRWHRRLAFDELFFLGLAVARRRRARREGAAAACPGGARRRDVVATALPFVLTEAQARAIAEISADLAATVPMNRLLQGDVGSGKTAVAFAAAQQVAAAARQVAVMAPTEILAEQHAAGIGPWCASIGLQVELLTASTPVAARRSILAAVSAGEIDVLIGTHSLISDGVQFSHLGLAIVDEQHRFGVAQRVQLRRKGDAADVPHLLVMTATPIPRTLALTAYGDLDVTAIDELPPGRRPPVTRVHAGKRGRASAYRRVRAAIGAGGRAFVVCPLVEPSDESDGAGRTWADVISMSAELTEVLAPARIGLVHGRIRQAERDRVMRQFRDGDLDVLVATTVIEVGVDVPEATVIAIEDADRFGLAQLHQLRGRVGRGGGASECLLLTRGTKTAGGAERLAVMANTTDGFAIAEADLRMRGPGELLGARQAGLPKLRFGDLREHVALLTEARAAAHGLLERDPGLSAHPIARQVLASRTRSAPAYGAEGG